MRPVARIAQSVEQGIENPRVLGSIPSPGTTNSWKPAHKAGFAFRAHGIVSGIIQTNALSQRQKSSKADNHAQIIHVG